MNSFLALDVETANQDIASICQIGVARFHNGTVIDTWSELLDPGCEFSVFNIRVHGIVPSDVVDKPTFGEIHDTLLDWISEDVTVCHTMFDRQAVNAASDRLGLPRITTHWVDSCALARRAWPDRRRRGGYGLKALAGWLEIDFCHHDALEDAITCGKIARLASAELGMTVRQYATQSPPWTNG